jgi:eukaryotic-like serine/threonine-protein kinase
MLKNYSLFILLGLVFTFSACKEDTTVPKSSAKAITKLTFPQFNPVVQATIDETTKRITAVVPPTADVTKLIPSISVSLKAKVSPDSGKVQDFTNDVTYSVTAEDGTKADYKVMVSRTKFSGKDILTFTFADFSPAVVAKIDPATKTITATVPATADLTKLKPTITLSDRATINPASATVVDFSKPVNFTVTAEDAGTQVYAVTVVKEIEKNISNNETVLFGSSDGNLYALNARTGEQTWNAKASQVNFFDNTPIVSNGDVYYVNSYKIDAYDIASGKFKKSISSSNSDNIYGTPLIDNGIMYFGPGKELYAYDLSTSKIKWTFKTDAELTNSPTLSNGLIYFGTGNFFSEGSLYAINANDGTLKWKTTDNKRVQSNPTVFNNTVYFCGSSTREKTYLYAAEASTGKLKWSFDVNAKSSPTIVNGILYIGTNSDLLAIDAEKGTQIWAYRDGLFDYMSCGDSSPFVDNGIVYIGGSGNDKVYAIDAKLGTLKWTFSTGDNISSSPTVANGTIYIGCDNGYLYALDSKTGAKIWQFKTGRNVQSSATVIDKQGKIYYSGISGLTN